MKIGILGAGQLGRMLALAGFPLDLQFRFLDPAPDACASALGEHHLADYADTAALERFCEGCDAVTYEFENVPTLAAEFVTARLPLRPGVAALSTSQDRLNEKRLFDQLGIPVPRYVPVATREALHMAARSVGLPAVLKTRRLGYDGKGQAVLRSPDDIDAAWAELSGGRDTAALILEGFVRFDREISCIAARAQDGGIAFYPVCENRHVAGILRVSRPRAADPLQALAEDYTRRVLEALDYVGVLAFEFFVVGSTLAANEIAPRVHNSGHWSIEGAEVSQFENHLRAVIGLPLGDTAQRGPSAMVNLIGRAPDSAALLAIPGVHLHLYGKSPKLRRKIGHLTVTAPDEAVLEARLAQVLPLVEAAQDG